MPRIVTSKSGKTVYIVGNDEALKKVPDGAIWLTEAEVKATVPGVGELVLLAKQAFGSENIRVRFTGKAVENKHYVKRGLSYELEEKNEKARKPWQGQDGQEIEINNQLKGI